MMYCVVLCLSACLQLLAAIWGFGETSHEFEIDWRTGAATVRVSTDLSTEQHPLPKAKQIADREVEQLIAGLFMESLTQVYVDSYHNLAEVVAADLDTFGRINVVAQQGRKELSYLSLDLRNLNLKYSFPLFGTDGIVAALITHSEPYPIQQRLGYVSSRAFSGLIIYAKGTYQAIGKDQQESIRPALFPRIFDEEMDLVVDKNRCYPHSLQEWGMVIYTDSTDEQAHLDRIGFWPLRTMARGVFGKNATDIVISVEAARKLLYRGDNLELLREGRIMVILGSTAPSSATE